MKNETLNFYHSKWFFLKFVPIGLILIWIGITCLDSNYWFFKISGIGTIIIGATASISSLLEIFQLKPQLILNELGIKNPKISKHTIPWSQLSKIEILNKDSDPKMALYYNQDIDQETFKLLYKRTARSHFNKQMVLINLKHLKIDLLDLETYLSSKVTSVL